MAEKKTVSLEYGNLLVQNIKLFLKSRPHGRESYLSEAIPSAQVCALTGQADYTNQLIKSISAFTDIRKKGLIKNRLIELFGDSADFCVDANLALGITLIKGVVDTSPKSDVIRSSAVLFADAKVFFDNDDYVSTAADLACIAMAHGDDINKVTQTYNLLSKNTLLKKAGIKSPEAITILTSYAMLTSVEEVAKAVDAMSPLINEWEDDQALALASVAGYMFNANIIANKLKSLGSGELAKESGFDKFSQMGKMMFVTAEGLTNLSEEELLKMYSKFYSIKGVDDWGALRMLLAWAGHESKVKLMTQEDSRDYKVEVATRTILAHMGKTKMNGVDVMQTNIGVYPLSAVPPAGTLIESTAITTETENTRTVIFLSIGK